MLLHREQALVGGGRQHGCIANGTKATMQALGSRHTTKNNTKLLHPSTMAATVDFGLFGESSFSDCFRNFSQVFGFLWWICKTMKPFSVLSC
jgi:hypothetical protein